MTPADAFAICGDIVRRSDTDRYLAALFAPEAKRPALYAIYAFNHELARASEMTGDLIAAEFRLQWWRDAVMAAREGRPPAHPVAVALAEILARDGSQAAELEALVDARVVETSPAPFYSLAEMEGHAQATSARLVRLAEWAIAGTHGPAEGIDDAGIAYGLTGMLRSFRFHALRGKIFLPADLLAAECLSRADIGASKNLDKLKHVFDKVGSLALDHLRRIGRNQVPRVVISAVLPASLVPAYLSRLAKNADPFREGTDVLRLRKQLIMLRAALRGRL